MTDAAAVLFAVVIAGVVAFQIALALGAPWGAYAMGGAFSGRFPPRMRVAAVIQAVVLGLLAIAVLSDAGIILPAIAATAPWLVWAAVAVSVLSLILNVISPSPGERRIWVPVALVLTITSGLVALAA